METKLLSTWSERKKYIFATTKLTAVFLILTLILPTFGLAGIWMGILTGFATVASLICLFVHIYIVSFSDCKDF